MATFPTGIASLNNPLGSNSMADPTILHSVQHTNANDEIEAIETELGTDPSGVYATVGARIAALEAALASAVPSGAILSYTGTTAPSGYLLPIGQVVLRATYPALFALYGTTFNTGGELATEFRMPDLRGRTLVGVDNMGGVDAGRLAITNAIGVVGGAELLTLVEANLPAHVHTVNHGHAATFAVTSMTGSSGGQNVDHSHTVPDHAHGAYTYGGNGAHSHAALATTRSIYAAGGSNAGLYALNYNTPTTTDGGHEHNVGVNGSGAIGTTGASVGHVHSIDHGHTMTGTVTDFAGNSGSVGSGTAISIMQPYMTVTYIIKT
jgi:microcystin-dependent protein